MKSYRFLGTIFAAALLGSTALMEPASATPAPSATNTEVTAPSGESGQLWTCGMHPQVVQEHAGECPICHMELTPLTSGQTSTSDSEGVVRIDPALVQNMGIRTVAAVEGPLRREVRVAGFIEESQPLIHDVNLRVSGWIRHLHAHTEGLHVSKGDPLFDLYSPEVQVAAEELIALRKRREASRQDGTLDALWKAAQRKLSLQGLDDAEIRKISRMNSAPDAVTFRSPISGHVTEKPIVDGSAVEAGSKALRIVDHSEVWIDAQVYEQDIALVRIGQTAEAHVTAQADKTYKGEVVFIHPHLDPTTRTARVRLAVPNPALELRPGMFATVVLRGELAPIAVLVPQEAVIDTGDRQVAFVVGSEPGHFEPRRVKTGWVAEGGNVQILEGLHAGEEVVVSGQFLLDAESRLQDALRKFLAQRASDAGQSGGNKNADDSDAKPHASSTQQPPVPSGQQPPVPSGQQPPVPSGQQPPVPSGQQLPVPSGQQLPVPSGQQLPVPSGHRH